jgi:hypothetical protein
MNILKCLEILDFFFLKDGGKSFLLSSELTNLDLDIIRRNIRGQNIATGPNLG